MAGNQINTTTKLDAMVSGLEMCWKKGLIKVVVDLDAQVIMAMLQKQKHICHWQLQYLLPSSYNFSNIWI